MQFVVVHAFLCVSMISTDAIRSENLLVNSKFYLNWINMTIFFTISWYIVCDKKDI